MQEYKVQKNCAVFTIIFSFWAVLKQKLKIPPKKTNFIMGALKNYI